MSPIKGIEFNFNITSWGLGIFIDVGDFPGLFSLTIGPFNLSINKAQYWKNGII